MVLSCDNDDVGMRYNLPDRSVTAFQLFILSTMISSLNEQVKQR